MTLPLEGLLVIAIEQAVAAPLCTSRLRAAGARVIKIERSEGDFARNYDKAAHGESSYFSWINQGKESVVLDFKTEADHKVLSNMIGQADIVVQNLSPGALERAGLGSKQLQQQHPGLITCDISGYGDDENLADLRAYDLLVQAESGLLEVSGGPGELGRIGISICDIGAGMTAHALILEALLARYTTGLGRCLKVSLFDVAAEWMTVPFIHEQYGKGAPARSGLHHPSIAPYGAYSSGDGVQTLISIQNEREWKRLCSDVLGDASISVDERFNSNVNRVANRPALDQCIENCLAKLDADGFRAKLGAARIAYGAVNSTTDLIKHRALTTSELHTGDNKALALPISPQMANLLHSQREDVGALRTPRLGEHTDNITAEFS